MLCYALFLYTILLRLDDRSQEPDATFDDYYYPEGAYYHMADTDDQE